MLVVHYLKLKKKSLEKVQCDVAELSHSIMSASILKYYLIKLNILGFKIIYWTCLVNDLSVCTFEKKNLNSCD